MTNADTFISSFNILAAEVHGTAKDKGWWAERDSLVAVAKAHSEELGGFAETAIRGLGIALKHSELSEALENVRHDYEPDDKIPEFTGEEAEYADTIIRIMDTAMAKNLRVAEALVAKMQMNKGRSHKHGGKTC
jgi:hypothetical protein